MFCAIVQVEEVLQVRVQICQMEFTNCVSGTTESQSFTFSKVQTRVVESDFKKSNKSRIPKSF